MQTDTRFRANGIKCRRASRVEYSLFGGEREREGGGGGERERANCNPLIARQKKSPVMRRCSWRDSSESKVRYNYEDTNRIATSYCEDGVKKATLLLKYKLFCLCVKKRRNIFVSLLSFIYT